MLEVNHQSDNEVYISGILNELEIVEGKTNDGRDYVRGTASVRVDQEINGKVCENIIPVKMFAMRKKKDNTDNVAYDRIVGYKESLTSVAAAEDESMASQITISKGRLEENAYFDTKINQIRSGYQISANFLNKKKQGDIEKATFTLSGVVGQMRPEIDKNGDETGRTIVKFVIIQWGEKADMVELIAAGSAKDFIEQNWNQGDTVRVTGRINMSYRVDTIKEEQGFGEPIERTRTISVRELLITGGSPSGLEEAASYDADSIKKALAQRAAAHKELEEKGSKPAPKSKATDFGF